MIYAPAEIEEINVTIKLANISPIGIVRDVEVLCGKVKYPADFFVVNHLIMQVTVISTI